MGRYIESKSNCEPEMEIYFIYLWKIEIEDGILINLLLNKIVFFLILVWLGFFSIFDKIKLIKEISLKINGFLAEFENMVVRT